MGLKKGQTNNRKGRPPGALNKVSGPLKEKISEFLESKFDELPKIWPKLSSKEQASLIVDLLPFVVAKIQAVNMDADLNFSTLSEQQLDEIAFKIYNYGKQHLA